LKRKDVKKLLLKMEDVKEAIVETLEDVTEVIVETAEDVKDFAVEKMKDFKETEVSLVDIVDASMEVAEILELAESKLKEIKETKMEEMVEEVKPRLRRETFENSLMLSRVGGRKFLLVLLVIAQTIVILLMLGLLFFLGGPPAPASPTPVPVPDPGMDWLRLLLDLLAASIIPLLTWLLANAATKPYRGVKRCPWGEESLLREDTDESLWFFGPAGENNYRVAGVRMHRSGRRELEEE